MGAMQRVAFVIVSLPLLATLFGGRGASPEAVDAYPAPLHRAVPYSLREVWRAGGLNAPEELQFAGPFFVLSFSPGGKAFVLDQTLSTVTALDGATGNFRRRFGGPGRGPGELANPGAMAWDPLGRLWVANSFDGRYSVFDSAGGLEKTVRRPAHGTSRRVFPLVFTTDGWVLDHDALFPRLRFLEVDTLGAVRDSLSISLPPVDMLSGIIRPGSSLGEVSGLRPLLRWTYARDGRSIWTTRSDSLTLIQLSPGGDTLRVVRHHHRSARFTPDQREAIAKANHELGREGHFVPVLVQALYTLEDGRVLAQIGSSTKDPGHEFDVFGADGRLLGTLTTPLSIDHRSEIASRGDTLLVTVLGAYDVPIVVKAVLEAR